METREEADSIVSRPCGGNKGKVADTFLNGLGVLEKKKLNYEEFRAVCAALFERDEIEENEGRIREIFGVLDLNTDGVLMDQEWNLFYEWTRVSLEPVNVLMIIDMQNDFIDGSLSLRGCGCGQDGVEVIDPINRLVKEGKWDKIVYSLDWHPENHISFYENLHMRDVHSKSKIPKESAKPFDTVIFSEPFVEQKLWPKHCVMNTWGAELHKDLIVASSSEQIRKGCNPEFEAYSVFSEKNADGSVTMSRVLSKIRATHLYVCGLAYDICVKETCLDGLRFGYPLAVVDDCCRGVDIDDVESTKELISKKGGLVTHGDHVLSLVNKTRRSLVMSHQAAKLVYLRASDRNVIPDSAVEASDFPMTLPYR